MEQVGNSSSHPVIPLTPYVEDGNILEILWLMWDSQQFACLFKNKHVKT
jgi:hypothetical protein